MPLVSYLAPALRKIKSSSIYTGLSIFHGLKSGKGKGWRGDFRQCEGRERRAGEILCLITVEERNPKQEGGKEAKE